MLEKAGLKVKVLQMKDAKDPDEFLQKFGADKFRLLLEDSANRVEYQLNAILKKYDIQEDDQRVTFIHEAAELISTLPSAVQREVYGSRVAETGKISPEAMKLEVEKAYKRRLNREKKKQEKIDLSPAQNLQPKSRTIRYDNMKSAMAEEGILSLVLRDSALLDQVGDLKPGYFSSPLLGRIYGQLKQRHDQGLEVSLAVLEDLTPEEMSHITGIVQHRQELANEQALADCVAIVCREYQGSQVSSEDDLRAFQNRLKERKGFKE